MQQMLVTNQWIDKLTALCMLFKSHGMLNGTCLSDTLHRLCRLPNPLTWITLLTVNITSQKQLMKVHADEGDKCGGSDDRDTNNGNCNNDGKDSTNNSDADDDNDVAISAPSQHQEIWKSQTMSYNPR